MKLARNRLSLVEYGRQSDLINDISDLAGINNGKARQLLLDAGARVAKSLGFSKNPLIVDEVNVRATDFAGIIRLAPSLELEVAPKFLGLDDVDTAWREDFFFLATLSRHGRLLGHERLSSSGGAPRDLSTLVARSIVGMYESRKRRPLRSYRVTREKGFFLDGDPDPVDLVLPTSEGYEQEVMRFDRRNAWNADIVEAAKVLLPEVSDPSTLGSLVRLIEELSPQGLSVRTKKPIPARHAAWRPLHELAVDVLDGLGMSYRRGRSSSPGFVVKTWQIWEDLLLTAAKLGFGRDFVSAQKRFSLGSRVRLRDGFVKEVPVFPDVLIEAGDNHPQLVFDAKYKGHVERGYLRISEADIYEALAFARASKCNNVVLAYPATVEREICRGPGECVPFEEIEVGEVRIVGVQIESRLVSKSGGLKLFSENLAHDLSEIFDK